MRCPCDTHVFKLFTTHSFTLLRSFHHHLSLQRNMPSRTMSQRCRHSITSMSLGRAAFHKLPHKLDMAQKYGIEGIELFYEDLEVFAKEKYHDITNESLLKAASDIEALCSARELQIVCLQPFMHYEGLRDRAARSRKLEELALWCELARSLRTDLIGLPSSFLSRDVITGDFEILVEDLRQAADVAASHSPPIRLAYEALAWGTYVDTWEQSWELVQRVDRTNFGLMLDSFNFAARVFADPAAANGKIPNGELELQSSCKRLAMTVDVAKIFFIQVVDGSRLERALIPGHEYYNEEQPARLSWSRNCRLFYGEQDRGGYLPIRQILRTYLDLGYHGWLSHELFSYTLSNPDSATPEAHAKRAARAWMAMVEDMHLNDV